MTKERVKFSGVGLEFEGILHLPLGEGPFPSVVVCHPHPLYGGDMHSTVVVAICQALAEASIAALRFNFRGVGRSQGEHAEGIGEQRDVVSALTFLSSLGQVDSKRIGLAGYSFGAKVVMPVAVQNKQIRAVAFVSPFFQSLEWQQLDGYDKPKLFLCGGADPFISSSEVERLSGTLIGQTIYEAIPGADHFWWGYEGEVGQKVSAFFITILKSS